MAVSAVDLSVVPVLCVGSWQVRVLWEAWHAYMGIVNTHLSCRRVHPGGRDS